MIRRYFPLVISTLLYIVVGVALGAIWYASTGRTDMPPWVLVLLVVVASLISDVIERVLRAQQTGRRPRRSGVRHRKQSAR